MYVHHNITTHCTHATTQHSNHIDIGGTTLVKDLPISVGDSLPLHYDFGDGHHLCIFVTLKQLLVFDAVYLLQYLKSVTLLLRKLRC
jgi:hypothetical protein